MTSVVCRFNKIISCMNDIQKMSCNCFLLRCTNRLLYVVKICNHFFKILYPHNNTLRSWIRQIQVQSNLFTNGIQIYLCTNNAPPSICWYLRKDHRNIWHCWRSNDSWIYHCTLDAQRTRRFVGNLSSLLVHHKDLHLYAHNSRRLYSYHTVQTDNSQCLKNLRRWSWIQHLPCLYTRERIWHCALACISCKEKRMRSD